MRTFNEWLEERDPELHQEVWGGFKRAAAWTGQKLLPTALNAAMVLAAPISAGQPHQHGDPYNPNKATGIVQDDTANYMLQRQRRLAQKEQEARQGMDKALRNTGIATMKKR